MKLAIVKIDMGPKQRKGKEKEDKSNTSKNASTTSQNEKKVVLPSYSLFGQQYLGMNLAILGSLVVVCGQIQNLMPSTAFVGIGFVIALVGLFFHEIRPYQRKGYGDITDEFKEGMKRAEEDKRK